MILTFRRQMQGGIELIDDKPIAMVEMGSQCRAKRLEPYDDSQEKVLWNLPGFPSHDERAIVSAIAVGAQVARPANVVTDLELARETLPFVILTAVAAGETLALVILAALAAGKAIPFVIFTALALLRRPRDAKRGLQREGPYQQGSEQAEYRHHSLECVHLTLLTLSNFPYPITAAIAG